MIIGILVPIIIDNWDKGIIMYALLFIAVALLAWFCYTSCQYYKDEKDINTKIRKLEEQVLGAEKEKEVAESHVKSFDKGVRELTALFYDSSTSINEMSKNILKGNRILDVWNFKKVSTSVCSSVYNVLCEICKPQDDFTVNIVLTDASVTGSKRSITMIAHKGRYEKYPDKFEEKMLFSKYPSFYAVKLFKSNSTDIKILTTKEEVNEHFVYVDEEHPEYSQYVGIPIVCSGNKMICLLQICAFEKTKIGESKADILDKINKYIIPFTHFALLAYKIEKGMISSLSNINKEMEEVQNGKN